MINPFSLRGKIRRLSADFARRYQGGFALDDTNLIQVGAYMAPTVVWRAPAESRFFHP